MNVDDFLASPLGQSCIEAMAKAAYEEPFEETRLCWSDAVDGRSSVVECYRVESRAALRALFSVGTPCTECGGDGFKHQDGRIEEQWEQTTNEGGVWWQVLCPACEGSGRAPLPAVLDAFLEPITVSNDDGGGAMWVDREGNRQSYSRPSTKRIVGYRVTWTPTNA